MAKVAVISDIHYGVRNDNAAFLSSYAKFFSNVFFPELDKRGIEHVINAGDFFDNRKKIDVLTAHHARKDFLDPLFSSGRTMDIIAGNHDVYYRESNSINALREVLDDSYDNIQIYTEPTDVTHGTSLLYVPWINKSNRQQTIDAIANTGAEIAFGHLELYGYQLYRGQLATKGDDPAMFSKFKHVFTGHYHHKSTQANVTYLGSVHQHTWADYPDVRGFHIFDTNSYEIEFIPNPYSMFETIKYGDVIEPERFTGKYVRIYYDTVDKQSTFNAYVAEITAQGPFDLKQIQVKSAAAAEQLASQDQDDVEVEDTLRLMRSMVDDDGVFNKLESLYNVAHEVM